MGENNRRFSDERMITLENTLNCVVETVTAIRVKMSNGYEHTMRNTNEKVKYMDIHNSREHEKLEKGIEKISTELRADVKRILFTFISATFLILLSLVIREIVS